MSENEVEVSGAPRSRRGDSVNATTTRVHVAKWACPKTGCDTSVTASSSRSQDGPDAFVALIRDDGCPTVCGRAGVDAGAVSS
jgi:hypothetical protein